MSKAYDDWFNHVRDENAEWGECLESAWNAGYAQFFEDNPGAVLGTVSELKPDRRAELLELASRLVASPWKEAWETGTIRGELNRTTEEKRKAVFELVARDSTLMAAAIIAEVDRVSGEVKA